MVPERFCDPFAFARFVHDAREISKHHVILEECARVLRDRIERPPERSQRLSVQRVRMRCADHIRPCVMDARVDRERRNVDLLYTINDFALRVHQNQI